MNQFQTLGLRTLECEEDKMTLIHLGQCEQERRWAGTSVSWRLKLACRLPPQQMYFAHCKMLTSWLPSLICSVTVPRAQNRLDYFGRLMGSRQGHPIVPLSFGNLREADHFVELAICISLAVTQAAPKVSGW